MNTVTHLVSAFGREPTVDWRQLIIAGMRLPPPTPDDVLDMCRRSTEAREPPLDRTRFVQQSMWFDEAIVGCEDQSMSDSEKPIAYSRARGCKELLFDMLSQTLAHDGEEDQDHSSGNTGSAGATLSLTTAAVWLCKMDDSVMALRTAITIAQGKSDAAVASDTPVDLETVITALNYDATARGSSTSDANPVSRVALTALWAENGGKCTVDELVQQHPEVAHCVETRFGRIDLLRHSNLVQ